MWDAALSHTVNLAGRLSLALGLREWATRYKLRAVTSVGEQPIVRGRIWIHGGGTVVLGDRVELNATACAIEIHAAPGAEIVLGDDVFVDAGVSIEARESVRIGDRSRIGRYCKILDNNFHSLRGDRHEKPGSTPVVVEDDTDLGPMTVLLPGARIGKGTDVGCGRVISRPVGMPKAKGPTT
ncbi:MAG: hypothetical protein A2289_15680 [Deltaproteobacteria bacterium RIFOXYA12_FULL_58_15]|nr:MAG: hypothetical protein A2289_15680 [Deltaproteobacteria bacterium RIFOXYA12_FULL_58_15]